MGWSSKKLSVKKIKVISFNNYPVVDKVKARLSKWKVRHLSFAGRLTLLKSVLGSIPSYYLSLFYAPKSIVNKIDRIRKDFLWGITDTKKKLRWARWDFMLSSKKAGGLGIGRIRDFNLAMLTKWWWRFKSNPNQLWAEVIAGIHKNNSGDQLIPIKISVPGVWKDIGGMKQVLEKMGIIIGDNLILKDGCWSWRSNKDKTFSVKQVRIDIEGSLGTDSSSTSLFDWNIWSPPKVKLLMWRALLGKVASKVGLDHRGISVPDVSCPRCGINAEHPDHIFFNCLWARSLWWNVLSWVRLKFPLHCASLSALVSYIKETPGGRVWKKLVQMIVAAMVWRIWSARNAKVFEGKFIPIRQSVDLVKEDTFLWICNRSKLKKLSWENWDKFDVVDLM
ncbi:uncharacterized protein LOC110931845 [Helianthus annuus]|uniref:uncharacterized protein LOC110931845 n=1 Tax=Helianthus annuus TaxID=4232 RepID=UPI000B8F72F3|nr:uncharacterized protein LOC110931845 [Helianthus annuus]